MVWQLNGRETHQATTDSVLHSIPNREEILLYRSAWKWLWAAAAAYISISLHLHPHLYTGRGILALQTDLHQFCSPPKWNQLEAAVEFSYAFYWVGHKHIHTNACKLTGMHIFLVCFKPYVCMSTTGTFSRNQDLLRGFFFSHLVSPSFQIPGG